MDTGGQIHKSQWISRETERERDGEGERGCMDGWMHGCTERKRGLKTQGGRERERESRIKREKNRQRESCSNENKAS